MFAYLRRYPRDEKKNENQQDEDLLDIDEMDDDDLQLFSTAPEAHPLRQRRRDPGPSTRTRIRPKPSPDLSAQDSPQIQVTVTPADDENFPEEHERVSEHTRPPNDDRGYGDPPHDGENTDSESQHPKKQPWFVLPLYSVLATSSVGLLSFMAAGGADAQTVGLQYVLLYGSNADYVTHARCSIGYHPWLASPHCSPGWGCYSRTSGRFPRFYIVIAYAYFGVSQMVPGNSSSREEALRRG